MSETRCSSCDGTGDLTRADGEYLGRCGCLERYEIVGKVMLTFTTHNDQYDAVFGPEHGHLEREGGNIYMVTPEERWESITMAHMIEMWLKDGLLKRIA